MEKKTINGFTHLRYKSPKLTEKESRENASMFYDLMNKRRSVRDFSDQSIPKSVIEHLIMTASSAPSGAHKQPWTFVAVSDKSIKSQIRVAAEQEEFESYNSRMSERWLKDLEPIGTNWEKPFLDIAPWLLVVFKKVYEKSEHQKVNNYYVNESVGIATGMLIAAIHNAGLVTLTHTPSPMNFLSEILNRPNNERPFLLLPVGFPATDAYVPDLERKSLGDVSTFI